MANEEDRPANLCGADLRGSNLRGYNLQEADLRGSNLRGANLQEADLQEADLQEADLQEADLQEADLRGADLRGAYLPSPQVVLSASWGQISDDLTCELMRYDAASHPEGCDPFSDWSNGGTCPYFACRWQRAANFTESKDLWVPGPSKTPWELARQVLNEKCPGWDDDE